LVLLAAAGCGDGAGPQPRVNPTEPVVTVPPDGPGLRVLFVGNSLTAGGDVPGMVRAMAEAGGVTLHPQAVLLPGANLEDQWTAGNSRKLLAAARWDFVVLQQGPSSLPDSQADLKQWAATWADEVRKHGATPALYMVWPYRGQKDGFELVSKSYRTAAEGAKARVLPAGEAWREALRYDPALPLYSGDNLHAEPAGSYLAALVIARGLTGIDLQAVPARLTLASGQVVEVPEEQAAHLRRAAESTTFPPDPGKSP
jgi:hypothetical protein